jgi:UDP-GlcNAc:undecaprenyl-phosphate GlcNAc-1-phosphate transferase
MLLPKFKFKIGWLEIISTGLIAGMVGLFFCALPNLPDKIALFYTLPWGPAQLANTYFLLALPIIGAIFFVFNLSLRSWAKEINTLSLIINLLLAIAMFKTISAISPLWPHFYFDLKNIIAPLLLAGFVTWLLARPTIYLAKKLKIMDDPTTHHHPGMLLTKPVPRAGAVAFFCSFFLVMFLIVPHDQIPWGIVGAALLYTVLGVIDDRFDNLFNPYARLTILVLGAGLVALSGVGIKSFSLPFGTISLDSWAIPLPGNANDVTYLLADLFTVFWIVWVSNLLSWSNGIDGQFAGVAGITALFIALLSLRLIPTDPNQIQTTRIAAIAAGAILGLVPVTWHPCKILWGFGATAVGLVLASLSIISGSKVATASLVVLIPFLDAIFTMARRIYHKKSPLWGDRGHLHHKLLDAGLNQPQVALLYWAATISLGVIAVFMTGKVQLLAIMTAGLGAVSLLVLINAKGRIKIPPLIKRALPSPKVKVP